MPHAAIDHRIRPRHRRLITAPTATLRCGPNPTLGPIATAPYYAVRLYPGDIGAATGLVVNEWAQVTRADNSPIAGLYACGNEANSIMGGTYPGPGITIGPAITFAYRAIRHALGEPRGAPCSVNWRQSGMTAGRDDMRRRP